MCRLTGSTSAEGRERTIREFQSPAPNSPAGSAYCMPIVYLCTRILVHTRRILFLVRLNSVSGLVSKIWHRIPFNPS